MKSKTKSTILKRLQSKRCVTKIMIVLLLLHISFTHYWMSFSGVKNLITYVFGRRNTQQHLDTNQSSAHVNNAHLARNDDQNLVPDTNQSYARVNNAHLARNDDQNLVPDTNQSSAHVNNAHLARNDDQNLVPDIDLVRNKDSRQNESITHGNSPQTVNVCTGDHAPIKIHYFKKPKWIKPEWFQPCDCKCVYTYGRKPIKNADAVIFHTPDLQRRAPMKRKGQVWIFHALESPVHFYGARRRGYYKQWKNKVNFTVTYRRDSDVTFSYGKFVKLKNSKNETEQQSRKWRSKTKLVAAAISNCKSNSKRLAYLKELQKYLHIDVYGKCGNLSKVLDIDTLVKTKYKFYISFENSLCVDYITEKAYRIYQNRMPAIPITRGVGKDYSIFLPPRSFINAADFSSPKLLSDYISNILKTESSIGDYFTWQNNYESPSFGKVQRDNFCELCRKLHHKTIYRNLYSDIEKWIYMKSYKEVCNVLGPERATDL